LINKKKQVEVNDMSRKLTVEERDLIMERTKKRLEKSTVISATHQLSDMPVFSIQDIESVFILSFDTGVYWSTVLRFLTEVINIKQEVLTEKQLNWLWKIKTDLSSNRTLTQLESIRRRVRDVF